MKHKRNSGEFGYRFHFHPCPQMRCYQSSLSVAKFGWREEEQCFSHRRRDYPFKWSGYGSIGPNELLNITAKGEGESRDGWIDESWTGDRGKCDRHYDEGDDNGSAADEDTLRGGRGTIVERTSTRKSNRQPEEADAEAQIQIWSTPNNGKERLFERSCPCEEEKLGYS